MSLSIVLGWLFSICAASMFCICFIEIINHNYEWQKNACMFTAFGLFSSLIAYLYFTKETFKNIKEKRKKNQYKLL